MSQVLRETDVPIMMMRVEATLEAAARAEGGARGVLQVAPEGGGLVNVAKARRLAAIEMEFPAGSERPVVGPAIGFAKRALRRSLRWYLRPMMDQQTRFNQAALDLVEGLRLGLERLGRQLERLEREQLGGFRAESWFRTCRRVAEVVGRDAAPASDHAAALRRAGIDVLTVDTEALGALEPAPADGVLAAVAELDSAEIVPLLEAAHRALAPGGRLALLTADAARVPPGALAWATAAAGFGQVRLAAAEPPASDPGRLTAGELDRVAALFAGPAPVAVLAVRPEAPA